MTTQLWIDENDFVRGFPFHDGCLDGLLGVDSAGQVHLALRSVDGEQRVLTLSRVTHLTVENYLEGNRILDMRLIRPARVSLYAEVARKLLERLCLDCARLAPDASVFWLTTSYGAEIFAVCGDARISDVGVTLSPTRAVAVPG